jgi:hypothetical protein
MEAFLAENFFKNKNLSLKSVVWGHWSNREINPNGNPYGKLFGNHYFADANINDLPKIYILRDGRAVAYSIWKTRNFVHKDANDMDFKTFLRSSIDWHGSPSRQTEPSLTILEHWSLHVASWLKMEQEDVNTLIVRYKDLVNKPYSQYKIIRERFFKNNAFLSENELDCIRNPVGLLPNQATTHAWENVFDEDDNKLFINIVKQNLPNEIVHYL